MDTGRFIGHVSRSRTMKIYTTDDRRRGGSRSTSSFIPDSSAVPASAGQNKHCSKKAIHPKSPVNVANEIQPKHVTSRRYGLRNGHLVLVGQLSQEENSKPADE